MAAKGRGYANERGYASECEYVNEQDLMHRIMLAISAAGHHVFRTNVGKVKLSDGRWFDTGLPKGHPDLYGFRRGGRVFYIECKMHPRRPTPEQVRFIKAMRADGAIAGVAYSAEEAMRILEVEEVKLPFSGMGTEIADKAADRLPGDHRQWLELLSMAAEHSMMLYGCLEWMRDTGCVLAKDAKYGYRIKPVLDDGKIGYGWHSEAEYKHEAEFLRPYQKTLVKMLAEIDRRIADDKHI